MRPNLVRAVDLLASRMPSRLRLTFRLGARRMLGELEPELASLERVAGRGRVAVDAGANEGWYSLRLARLFERVLAFEPNEHVLGDLRSAARPNLEIHACALSSRNGHAALHVPVRRGSELTGWASLDREHLRDRDGLITAPTRLATLDSFELPALDFLKIDVEGHEVEVCRGALETMGRFRPRVLVEVQDRHAGEIEELLESCGLTRSAPEGRRTRLSPGNVLYRPVDSGDRALRRA